MLSADSGGRGSVGQIHTSLIRKPGVKIKTQLIRTPERGAQRNEGSKNKLVLKHARERRGGYPPSRRLRKTPMPATCAGSVRFVYRGRKGGSDGIDGIRALGSGRAGSRPLVIEILYDPLRHRSAIVGWTHVGPPGAPGKRATGPPGLGLGGKSGTGEPPNNERRISRPSRGHRGGP